MRFVQIVCEQNEIIKQFLLQYHAIIDKVAERVIRKILNSNLDVFTRGRPFTHSLNKVWQHLSHASECLTASVRTERGRFGVPRLDQGCYGMFWEK